MSIQVLAVRLEGDSGLMDVAEVIYRDDDDGKLGYMAREPFAEWINDNPSIRVYVRDHLGDNRVVLTFSEGGHRYIKISDEANARDPLLRLPRYITPTKSVIESAAPHERRKAASVDPLAALWWFWWLPRD